LIAIKISKKRTDSVFRALADPTRRAILAELKNHSLTAGQIAEGFLVTKGTLSHHFNILKAADLVRCERRGQQLVYAINTSAFEEVAAALLDLFRVRSK
jgi:DNA-binding transcriptional ArsR family regulator